MVGGWPSDGSVHLNFVVGVAPAEVATPALAVAVHGNEFAQRAISFHEAGASSVWSSEIDSAKLKVKEELGRGRRSLTG